MKLKFFTLIFLFVQISIFSVAQRPPEYVCYGDSDDFGPLSETNKLIQVKGERHGYYEILSDNAAIYLPCGIQIKNAKGKYIRILDYLYRGTYKGSSGIWGLSLVDFDGVGPESGSQVYVFMDDVKKLDKEPDSGLLEDSFRNDRIKETLSVFFAFLLILLCPDIIIWIAERTRIRKFNNYVADNKINGWAPPIQKLNWRGLIASLPIAFIFFFYWHIEYNHNPSFFWMIVFSLIAASELVFAERIYRGNPKAPWTRNCPNCKASWVLDLMKAGEKVVGSVPDTGTRTQTVDVQNTYGQIIGAADASLPYQTTRAIKIYYYKCKT